MEVKNSVGPNAEQIAGFMEPGPSGLVWKYALCFWFETSY